MSWITSILSRVKRWGHTRGQSTLSDFPKPLLAAPDVPEGLMLSEDDVPQHPDPVTRSVLWLKKRDIREKVFGADGHKYKLTTVSAKELDDFENWCGSPLPEAYRKHLQTSGYGAGPAYGLLSPSEITETIRMELAYLYKVEDRKDTAAPQSLKDTCLLTFEDAEGFAQRVEGGVKNPFISAPMRGCLPLCHQGCSYWAVLQLTGSCAGHVWEICDESDSWRPALRPDGLVPQPIGKPTLPKLSRPPTFEEWFQGWLDQAKADLS